MTSFFSTSFSLPALWMCIFSLTAAAQVGEIFPEMQGETLDNHSVQLPADGKGKFTLVGLAYSKKAQKALETWANPAYHEFVDPSAMSAMVYDVNVYLVMMFTGANKVAYESAKKKIREGTDKKLFRHTFLFKGRLDEYEEKLNLPDKEVPAFYVLDKDGRIIHMERGAYSSRKFDKIASLVEN